MPEFLVETYVARGDRTAAEQVVADVAAAAATSTASGQPVGCRSWILATEDETCYLLLDAPDAEAAAGVVTRAGLTSAHVCAATSSDPHVDPHVEPLLDTDREMSS